MEKCTAKPEGEARLTLENVDTSLFPVLNPSASKNIVMVGSYHCDFTRKAYPMIRRLAAHYNVGLTFLDYPVKEKTNYFSQLSYTVYRLAPEKYWEFNDLMFAGDKNQLDDPAYIEQLLTGLGLDAKTILSVAKDPLTEKAIKEQQLAEVEKTGFYGTPTIFIQGSSFVGPKPYRVYAIALEGLLYWLR